MPARPTTRREASQYSLLEQSTKGWHQVNIQRSCLHIGVQMMHSRKKRKEISDSTVISYISAQLAVGLKIPADKQHRAKIREAMPIHSLMLLASLPGIGSSMPLRVTLTDGPPPLPLPSLPPTALRSARAALAGWTGPSPSPCRLGLPAEVANNSSYSAR